MHAPCLHSMHMASGNQRPPESLWLQYDAEIDEVYEDEIKSYSLDLSYLSLLPGSIKLNGVASLVDQQGITKYDKYRLQQRVKLPDGSSREAPIKITGKPQPGVVQGLLWPRGSGCGRRVGRGRSWQSACASQTCEGGGWGACNVSKGQ